MVNLKTSPVEYKTLSVMMSSMKHRGPDDEGVFIENGIGLGFVRLSILDLSPAGHQPMFSHDGKNVIVYNGEIFNYLEIKKELNEKGYLFRTGTDTEVLLAAYQEWGEKCLDKFNGMWAFAIYNRIEKTIFISRDRYGIKPLYYYSCDDYFVFASEIIPLLKIIKHKPSVNNQAIFDFLVFNRTDQYTTTMFDGIMKLRHGCNMKVDKSGTSISEWYNLNQHVKDTTRFRSPEEFRYLLSESIALRLRSDVPVGICLSGGLDSSSIASILIKDYNKAEIKTFSSVYGCGQTGDESVYINQFKNILPNMYFTTPDASTLLSDLTDYIRLHTEPVSDTGVYAQYKVMELAYGKVVVTLDGQGADEILAGYHYFFGNYFRELLRKKRIGKLSWELMFYILRHKSLFGLGSLMFNLISPAARTKVKYLEKRYLDSDFVATYKRGSYIAEDLYSADSLQAALLNHFEHKLEHLLKWEDKNSMRFSIEARMPFLDHRLVERTLALPADEIIKNGMTKYFLREAMKNTVPEEIRTRRDKIGFGTPNEDWFRTKPFRKNILELLHSEKLTARKIINPEKAMKIYTDHLNMKVNAAREIWKWINLEIWFREFVD